MGEFFDAASGYFKAPRERPKLSKIYREGNIASCLFTGDGESSMGAKRSPTSRSPNWRR